MLSKLIRLLQGLFALLIVYGAVVLESNLAVGFFLMIILLLDYLHRKLV